jgi:hypothetical protein
MRKSVDFVQCSRWLRIVFWQELDLRHTVLLERFEEQKTRKGAHAASKENAIVCLCILEVNLPSSVADGYSVWLIRS